MAENSSEQPNVGRRNILQRIFHPQKQAKQTEFIRTSEIRSSDGLLSVGDSMRKMQIKEEAEEEGRLINDGDAPQFKRNNR